MSQQPREIPRVPDTVEGRRKALGFRTPAELNSYMMEQMYNNEPSVAPSPARVTAVDSTRRLRLSSDEIWDTKGLQQEICTQTDYRVRYDVGVTAPAGDNELLSPAAAVERNTQAPKLVLPSHDSLSHVGLTELVRMEREVGSFLHTIQSEATKAMRLANVEYTPGAIDELTDSRLARRQLEYTGTGGASTRVTEAYTLDNPYGAPPGTRKVQDSLAWAENMTGRVETRLKSRFRDRVDLYSAEHERQTRYIDRVRIQVERRRATHLEVEKLLGEQHRGGYLNKPWLDALVEMQGTWKPPMSLDLMGRVDDPPKVVQPAAASFVDPTKPTPNAAAPAMAPDPAKKTAGPAGPPATLEEYIAQQIKSGEWNEATDPKTQKTYYVNKAKKTTWDLKKELAPEYEKLKAAAGGGSAAKPATPAAAAPAKAAPAPAAKPPSPAAVAAPAKAKTIEEFVEAAIKSGEWKAHTDPKTQKQYYVNKAKKTVWDLKKELMPEFEKQK